MKECTAGSLIWIDMSAIFEYKTLIMRFPVCSQGARTKQNNRADPVAEHQMLLEKLLQQREKVSYSRHYDLITN